MARRRKPQYVTEDKVIVYEGDLVYDYYTMEPVIIGQASPAGGEWFDVQVPGEERRRASAGILNGQRICSIEYAALRDFPGAKAILAKTMAK
jgi:hypothetical protein